MKSLRNIFRNSGNSQYYLHDSHNKTRILCTSCTINNLYQVISFLFFNLNIAVGILLTVPTTNVCLSKASLPQTEMNQRTTMTQERSSTLVLLSVKQSYCENLDCNHIINDSTEIWARKAGLWKIYYEDMSIIHANITCPSTEHPHTCNYNYLCSSLMIWLSARKPTALDIF